MRPASARGPYRGIVAGLIVVAAGCGAIWWFTRPADNQLPTTDKPTTNSTIGEVNPSIPTNAVEVVQKPVDPLEDYDHEKKYRDARGILRYKNGGARAYDPATLPKPVMLMTSAKNSPFKHRSEQLIAGLLTVKPGNMVFSGYRFDERFAEDYEASLKEPIVVSETDSEDVKRMKRMMIETKIEIADRMRAGEKLSDILNGVAGELRRMAEYKRNLGKEINDMVRSGDYSDKDIDLYIDAANKMLSDNGIEPIRNKSFIKRNMRLNNKKGHKQ